MCHILLPSTLAIYCTHNHTNTDRHASTHICTHIHTHTHTHTYTHTHTRTHTHIHTHTHTHTHYRAHIQKFDHILTTLKPEVPLVRSGAFVRYPSFNFCRNRLANKLHANHKIHTSIYKCQIHKIHISYFPVLI